MQDMILSLIQFTAPDGRHASVTVSLIAAPVLIVVDKVTTLKTYDGGKSYGDGEGMFYLADDAVLGHLSYICDTPVSFTPWTRLG